jgi:predicted XRE-type DNA-binding protein
MAAGRIAQAELARIIRREIRGRTLTQTQAAELLGITQPDVSDLVWGTLGRFSMERLDRFLNALDMEVRIQVRPKPKDKDRAGISPGGFFFLALEAVPLGRRPSSGSIRRHRRRAGGRAFACEGDAFDPSPLPPNPLVGPHWTWAGATLMAPR